MTRRFVQGCVLLLALVACSRTEQVVAGAEALRKVRVQYTPHLSWGPIMIAQAEGFFREEGLYTFVRWNTFFTNPPLCVTEPELREAFNIIDRGPELTDRAVV